MGRGARLSGECNAKINLFLRITGRRDDGYHNIRTLFVPLDLHDTITLTPAPYTSLRCNVPHIPVNHKNIILKTDKILREEYGFDRCFRIDLIKRIPTGAGLGGGSSDAACYLNLAAGAAGLELSDVDKADIMRRVGSDTVFFLRGRPALGSGRGDVLEDFDFLPDFHVLLINPRIHVSTRDIYSSPELVLSEDCDVPEITSPMTFGEMTAIMKNDMELPVFNMYAEVKELVEKINSRGRGAGRMSGSGATVFGVYESESLRDEDYEAFRAEYPSYFIKKAETLRWDGR